ncbi:hypothetical protein SCUP234_08539 [Seiridium cupressi]
MTSPSPKGCVKTTLETETTTSTRTVYTTETPTVTATPSDATVITTVTSTTTSTVNVDQITDTFTTVVTETTSSTEELPTQTITSTDVSSTTTTTTVQPTTTIATRDGFVPVYDSFPGSGMKKRSANGVSLQARKEPTCEFSATRGQEKPEAWPAAVTCARTVETFVITTVTRTAMAETLIAPTPTATETSTLIVTSTSLSTTPDASTTVTSTLTLTSVTMNSPVTTITTSVISTATETANLPASTQYAMCSSNNIAAHINSFQIDSYADQTGELGGLSTSDTTAEGCCNSCAANAQCGVSVFFAQTNFCILGIGAASCSVGQYSVGAGYNTDETTPLYVTSNGNCGVFNTNLG